MDENLGESSQVIFDHFRRANYDAVQEAKEKICEYMKKNSNEEESEAFQRQELMVSALLQYFKEGCKDPKRAYKALELIENEPREGSDTEVNYLLEYNCGVFAYL